jgi:hypothetical protein
MIASSRKTSALQFGNSAAAADSVNDDGGIAISDVAAAATSASAYLLEAAGTMSGTPWKQLRDAPAAEKI